MENSIKLNIEKCSIPIVWLDTSIIVYMTQYKHQMCNIEKVTLDRIKFLYEIIYQYTRKAKIICPLAGQKNEIWNERDKWLDTIHTLSLGIETVSLQSINDFQFNIFLKAFLEKSKEILLSYKNIFLTDPIKKTREALSAKIYITVNAPIFGGAEYQRIIKKQILDSLNYQREINVRNKVTFKIQLEKEFMLELLTFNSYFRDMELLDLLSEEQQFNAISGLGIYFRRVKYIQHLTGVENDVETLLKFYKSIYYRLMPYTQLKCYLMARMMTDKQPIRSGDIDDSDHVSTLMPFSNLFITDKAMSTFLNKYKYNEKYNTEICFLGDLHKIEKFFSKL